MQKIRSLQPRPQLRTSRTPELLQTLEDPEDVREPKAAPVQRKQHLKKVLGTSPANLWKRILQPANEDQGRLHNPEWTMTRLNVGRTFQVVTFATLQRLGEDPNFEAELHLTPSKPLP